MTKKIEDLLEEEKSKLEESSVETSVTTEETNSVTTDATTVAEETTEATSEVTTDDFDATADIDAIFGDVDVSEEFKAKAKRVYEASVIATANAVVEKVSQQLAEQFAAEAAELVEAYEAELNEEVDGFLSFVTEKWIKENQIPAASAIRAELAESFMDGLKALLSDHYVDLPEDKVDLVAAMEGHVAELEANENALLEQIVTLRKEKDTLIREQAINEMASELTDVERDKFVNLSEAIEFTNVMEYQERLSEIRESYFKKGTVVTSEFENEDVIEVIEESAPVTASTGFNVNGVLAHLGKTRRTAK